MQLKWLEDLIALAEMGSIVRAAQTRHVTQSALGRRLRSLEEWAGATLIERDAPSLRLTPSGEKLLEVARETVTTLASTRSGFVRQSSEHALHIATGRTLARTLLATWLARMQPLIGQNGVQVSTDTFQMVATLLESHEVTLMLTYSHPALALRLDARRFTHLLFAKETLVPMSACRPDGQPQHTLSRHQPCAWLWYTQGLALARLVEDHLRNHLRPPHLQPTIEIDSADVAHEYVLRGFGLAWLPRSMTVADCRLGRMMPVGSHSDMIPLDVRMYRPRKRLSPWVEALWAETEQSAP